MSQNTIYNYDFFISHASEDEQEVVRPLARKLHDLKYRVWYDEYSLGLEDSLSRSIDEGLSSSKYGIVIISPNFLRKEWPKRELNGLVAREIEGKKAILPVWHNVKYKDICKYSPPLADKLAVSTDQGLDAVIDQIEAVLNDKTKPGMKEIGYVQTPVENISSPSQPRQAGISLGKKARRGVLLGSTVLGVVVILGSMNLESVDLFFVGNAIILFGSLWVWIKCKPVHHGVRSRLFHWFSFIFFFAILYFLVVGVTEKGEDILWRVDFLMWVYLVFLLLYIISTFDRWW